MAANWYEMVHCQQKIQDLGSLQTSKPFYNQSIKTFEARSRFKMHKPDHKHISSKATLVAIQLLTFESVQKFCTVNI